MSATPLYPDGTSEKREPTVSALAGAYRVVADAFVYPEDLDRQAYLDRARTEVLPAVETHLDDETAARLSAFLDTYENLDVDEYVQTLELEPECPPYLGHHEFDEPETCRDIADADRNQYMVELNGIYEHFGFEIGDELPDYLPAMVEFCWLTLPDRDDEVRAEFVGGMLSLLPGMREAFEEANSPYHELLAALERLLRYDMTLQSNGASPAESAETGDTEIETDTDDRPTLETLDVDDPGDAVGQTGGEW